MFLIPLTIIAAVHDATSSIPQLTIYGAVPSISLYKRSWKVTYIQRKSCTNEAVINTLMPRQNGRHSPHDIVKCIFLNENVWILIEIPLNFVPKCPINNIPALVQKMAWRRPSDKPLSEPMMVSLLTHICVTRHRWAKGRTRQGATDVSRSLLQPTKYTHCSPVRASYGYTLIARPLGRVMGVFREFEVWPDVYLQCCWFVCSIVLYCTGIYRESIMYGIIQLCLSTSMTARTNGKYIILVLGQ